MRKRLQLIAAAAAITALLAGATPALAKHHHHHGNSGDDTGDDVAPPPKHGPGSTHNPIIYHPVHGPGSTHNPIIAPRTPYPPGSEVHDHRNGKDCYYIVGYAPKSSDGRYLHDAPGTYGSYLRCEHSS